MLKYDPEQISRFAGTTTARLISVSPSYPGESSVGDPAPNSANYGGEHCTIPGPSAPEYPADAPSKSSRPGTTAGPSGWFGALSRMFRRCRVAPLQTKPPDIRAPAPSHGTTDGRGTRKRWFACPWTSRSQKASRTAESNRVPTRRPRVLRSSRVAPVGDQAAMPSRGLGMRRTAAMADLTELDNTLRVTLPEKSQSKSWSNEPPDQSDEYAGAPCIDKKSLRFVWKDPHCSLILGRGQSGVVRLMRYRKPEGGSSLVAVKRYLARSHSAMSKEIRALRAVDHCPIFPELVGVISDYSFAQKFVGDPKTFQTLSVAEALITGEPPISSENWAWVLYDVITGLFALHQSGWAHCDLQCNNVLLWRDWSQSDDSGERWHGRIIDLGNAQRLNGPTSQCLTLTPIQKDAYYRFSSHIAPEVVEGLVPYGVKSDIYSMGSLISDIAFKSFGMSELLFLSKACMVTTPAQRPTMEALLIELDVWLQDHTGHSFFP
ncbi:uncharacterized protein LOC110986052 [Acanthaster planci]|uniref:Uncharacterized protein LOC110986052 n=1 Tax=Acanthaster planci TaxID=133434 RepID=A0A8B7ZCC7_ACAPL|nr:uncharacterized protein LOC110986052 [Acanthaster planci]